MATKKPAAPAPVERHRDAGTGHYVTEKYADKNPKTTVKETDRPSPKKGK
jgi:hypothetical protein